MSAQHTPTPWRMGRPDMISQTMGGERFKAIYVDDGRGGIHLPTGNPLPLMVAKATSDIVSGDYYHIQDDELLANAAHIVLCVNAHDVLDDFARNVAGLGDDFFLSGDIRDFKSLLLELRTEARAALKLAEPHNELEKKRDAAK